MSIVGESGPALLERLVGESQRFGSMAAEVVRTVLQVLASLAQSCERSANFRMRFSRHGRERRCSRLRCDGWLWRRSGRVQSG